MKLERLGSGWVTGAMTAPPDAQGIGAGPGGVGGIVGLGIELTDAEIEEGELVEWASLKECQMKFMRESGIGWVG